MVSYEINKAGQNPCFIYLVRAKGLELITNAADYLFYAIIFLAACSSLRSKLRVKNRGFHSDQYKRGTQGTPFALVRAKGLVTLSLRQCSAMLNVIIAQAVQMLRI